MGKWPALALAVLIACFAAAAAAAPIDAVLASLQPGEWFEVPNTKLAVNPGQPDPYPGSGSGFGAIMGAWSGGAFDTTRSRLIAWGGGHGDYLGNEIYAFDVGSLQWIRVTNPSVPGISDTPPYNPNPAVPDDGAQPLRDRPVSRHTYEYIEFIPGLDSFCSAGLPGSGTTYDNFDCFDFGGRQWVRKPDVPAASTGIGACAAVDGKGRMWVVHDQLSIYDPATNAWKQVTTGRGGILSPDGIGYTSTCEWDPINQRMLAIGRRVMSFKEDGSVQILSTSGPTNVQNFESPGIAYDPATEKIVAWIGGTDVYSFDVRTNAWTRNSAASTNKATPPPPTQNGIFGRWRFDPKNNVFVLVTGVDRNVFLYKFSAGSGTAACTEGATRQTGATDVGACEFGEDKCVNGSWTTTKQAVGPVAEVPNGLDDDCDGAVDEGLCTPNSSRACNTGKPGVCAAGTETCNASGSGYGACVQSQQPVAETCNGKDDDCDGQIDEGCFVGGDCKPDVNGDGGVNIFDLVLVARDFGKTGAGLSTDLNGDNVVNILDLVLVAKDFGKTTPGECVEPPACVPSPEICNNLDDDCDGVVDEGGVCGVCTPGTKQGCYTGPSGTQGIGLCKAGEQTCQSNQQWGPCTGDVKPSTDVCGNGLDEDCDGKDAVCVTCSAISLGSVEVDPPTFENLGFFIPVLGGDRNFNARVDVEYRKAGTQAWKDALPLLRVRPEYNSDESPPPGGLNLVEGFAGSVMGLEPGTSYVVRFHVTDPDGCDKVIEVTTSTRPEPRELPLNPRYINVSSLPELRNAVQNALPGDVITLANGRYSDAGQTGSWGDKVALLISNKKGTLDNPIVVRGESRTGTVLYADGLKRGIETQDSDYIYLKDFTIENPETGISLSGRAVGIVVSGNIIRGVDKGIESKYYEKRDITIEDNEVQGPWPFGNFSSETWNSEGIVVNGPGTVVRYNEVSGAGDAIGTSQYWDAPPGMMNRGIDIYGNDVPFTGDDGAEFDYSVRNIRVYANFFSNTGSGISFQPIFGGPGYAYRNIIVNPNSDSAFLKLNNQPNGWLVFNNLFVNDGQFNGYASYAYNGTVQNNLFVLNPKGSANTDIATGLFGINGDTPATWTHNAWNYDKRFRMGRMNDSTAIYGYWYYDNLADMQAKGRFGANDIILSQPIFADPSFSMPTKGQRYTQTDFTLHPSSNAVDSAVLLPTINDDFAGAGPDRGPWERGKAPPKYGPRWK